MVNKRGRPKTQIPLNLVKEIIYRFSNEKNISGKIKYMDVFYFSRDLYQKGEISYQISEYYWRKGKGRELIDKTNEVVTHSLKSSDTKEDDTIVDTEDAVNKLLNVKKNDKEKIVGALRINEQKLRKNINKCNRLEKQLYDTKNIVSAQKEKINDLEKKILTYEEKLFQWLELSINKDIPIYNIISTGKTRTPITKELLASIFSENPVEVFDKLKNIDTTDVNKSNPTTLYNFNEKKETVLDDFFNDN